MDRFDTLQTYTDDELIYEVARRRREGEAGECRNPKHAMLGEHEWVTGQRGKSNCCAANGCTGIHALNRSEQGVCPAAVRGKRSRAIRDSHTPGTYAYEQVHGIGDAGEKQRAAVNVRYHRRTLAQMTAEG